MKYPNSHIQTLLNGILPCLKPAVTTVPITKMISGGELLDGKIFKTESGTPIVRSKTYPVKHHKEVPINHEKKIRQLIRDARTPLEVEDWLASYLRRHAKSLEDIKK